MPRPKVKLSRIVVSRGQLKTDTSIGVHGEVEITEETQRDFVARAFLHEGQKPDDFSDPAKEVTATQPGEQTAQVASNTLEAATVRHMDAESAELESRANKRNREADQIPFNRKLQLAGFCLLIVATVIGLILVVYFALALPHMGQIANDLSEIVNREREGCIRADGCIITEEDEDVLFDAANSIEDWRAGMAPLIASAISSAITGASALIVAFLGKRAK